MIEAPLAWSHKLGPGVKQVLEDHWVSEGRRGLAFLLQRAQHVAAVSLTNLLKDQATTTSGFRLRCHQTTGPGSTCCVFDAIGSFEHGQRHPGGDQPRAVRSMRPDGVRNVPNISVGPSRTYLSQQPPASAI